MAAARYAKARGGKPCQHGTVTESPTNAQAAAKFDVNERAVDRAKKVVATGTPTLQEAVADETISVSDAAKVADESPAVQDEAVKKVRRGKAKTASAAAKTLTENLDPGKHAPFYLTVTVPIIVCALSS